MRREGCGSRRNPLSPDRHPTQSGRARVLRVDECADWLYLAAIYPREEPDALTSARPDLCGGHRASGGPTAGIVTIRLVNRANDEQRHEIPKRYTAVLRTIGALDSILSIFGLYLFLDPILRGLIALNAAVPNFRSVFGAMILSDGFLPLLFFFAAIQLLRLKRSGVTAHTTASVLLVAYDLLIAAFWAMGGRIGISVAAATGSETWGLLPSI